MASTSAVSPAVAASTTSSPAPPSTTSAPPPAVITSPAPWSGLVVRISTSTPAAEKIASPSSPTTTSMASSEPPARIRSAPPPPKAMSRPSPPRRSSSPERVGARVTTRSTKAMSPSITPNCAMPWSPIRMSAPRPASAVSSPRPRITMSSPAPELTRSLAPSSKLVLSTWVTFPVLASRSVPSTWEMTPKSPRMMSRPSPPSMLSSPGRRGSALSRLGVRST